MKTAAMGITIELGSKMGRQVAVALYVVAMIAVIVGVDFVFFRNRLWQRLPVNIGIVLVFAAFWAQSDFDHTSTILKSGCK